MKKAKQTHVPKDSIKLPKFRLFVLQRIEDVHGVSGTGTVALGIEYPNGWCALSWLTPKTSIAAYPDIKSVKAIHGHDGKTKVVEILSLDWPKVQESCWDDFQFDMENAYCEFTTPNHRHIKKSFQSLIDMFNSKIL